MKHLIQTLSALAQRVLPFYVAALVPPITSDDDERWAEVVDTFANLPESVLSAMLTSYEAAAKAESALAAVATSKGASTSNRMPIAVQAQQRSLALACAEAAVEAIYAVQAAEVENGGLPLLSGAYLTLLADGFRWNPIGQPDGTARIEIYDRERSNIGVRVNVVGSKQALYRFSGDDGFTSDKSAAEKLHTLKRPYVKRKGVEGDDKGTDKP